MPASGATSASATSVVSSKSPSAMARVEGAPSFMIFAHNSIKNGVVGKFVSFYLPISNVFYSFEALSEQNERYVLRR